MAQESGFVGWQQRLDILARAPQPDETLDVRPELGQRPGHPAPQAAPCLRLFGGRLRHLRHLRPGSLEGEVQGGFGQADQPEGDPGDVRIRGLLQAAHGRLDGPAHLQPAGILELAQKGVRAGKSRIGGLGVPLQAGDTVGSEQERLDPLQAPVGRPALQAGDQIADRSLHGIQALLQPAGATDQVLLLLPDSLDLPPEVLQGLAHPALPFGLGRDLGLRLLQAPLQPPVAVAPGPGGSQDQQKRQGAQPVGSPCLGSGGRSRRRGLRGGRSLRLLRLRSFLFPGGRLGPGLGFGPLALPFLLLALAHSFLLSIGLSATTQEVLASHRAASRAW